MYIALVELVPNLHTSGESMPSILPWWRDCLHIVLGCCLVAATHLGLGEDYVPGWIEDLAKSV